MSQAEVAALFEAGSGGDAAETALSEADRLASEACDLFVAAGIAGRIGSPETLAAFGEASSAASAAAVQEDRWMELAEKIELVALGFSGKATVDELDAGMTGMNDVTAFCREFD